MIGSFGNKIFATGNECHPILILQTNSLIENILSFLEKRISHYLFLVSYTITNGRFDYQNLVNNFEMNPPSKMLVDFSEKGLKHLFLGS